jgi:phenylalanine-4-hydroxylase
MGLEFAMRRDRSFLEAIPFARHEYASIVQTSYPGAHDAEYRARVSALVQQSSDVWPQIPTFEYEQKEHETWALVSDILVRLQDRYACDAFLQGRDALGLPTAHLPQLDTVSATMEAATGFMLAPVGGLLDKGEFLPMLEQKVMRCTTYVRHPSYPFFTPEPDILHELRGHAPMFMHEPFVEVSTEIGKAARAAVEAGNIELLDLIGLFYWYTVEYGLIYEGGEMKVFGAGCNGGIQDLLRAIDPTVEKKPFSMEAVRQLSIDYDAPQEVFFVAESFEQIAQLAYELGKEA